MKDIWFYFGINWFYFQSKFIGTYKLDPIKSGLNL